MTLVMIMLVLCSCLWTLFMLWVLLAALVRSGRDAEAERRIEAMKALGWQEWPAGAAGDYPAADALDGSEFLDGSEHNDG